MPRPEVSIFDMGKPNLKAFQRQVLKASDRGVNSTLRQDIYEWPAKLIRQPRRKILEVSPEMPITTSIDLSDIDDASKDQEKLAS